MKQPDRLGRNIVSQIAARFGAQILAIMFTILLARRLGSSGFGEYAFISALIFVGNALTTFGTDMLLIRKIASQGDMKAIPTALVLQLILSAAFILLTWASAPLIPNQSGEVVFSLKIYSLALIPLAFYSIFTIVLRGTQRMDTLMVLNLAGGALQLGGAWLFLGSGKGNLIELASILLACQAVTALIGAALCARQKINWDRGWRVSKEGLLSLARSSAPLGLMTLITLLYQRLSILMLAGIGLSALTGWYSGAARAVEAAKTAHLAAFTALYPAMAEEALPEERAVRLPWQGRFRFTWQLLLLGAAAAALLLFLFAEPISLVFLGKEFGPTAGALKILAWVLIPFTANTFLSLALLAEHREKLVLRTQVLGLAALLLLNSWAIPHGGLAGACIASVLAETLQTGAYLFQVRKLPWRGARRAQVIVSLINGGADGISPVPGKGK